MISPINELRSFPDNSRLHPTTKNNPCPICGDASGKCRTKDNEEQAVLCAGIATARKGDKEGQYICTNDKGRGHTTHTWILSNDDYQNWDEQRKIDYELEKQRRILIAIQERQAKIDAEISIDERDRVNRLILEQLALSDADKQHLLNRGFTSQQIEDWNFRSLNQGQRVKLPGCPAKFPGLVNSGFGDTSNRKMIVSGKGILCPILQDGKIVAFKIRFTEAKDGQRYSSVSCAAASFHVGGEQPLAVLHPPQPGYKPGIWITEGSEIKPVFLNQLYNVAVLGGGRYWHNSPNHAAKFLPLFRELYGNKIVLCPDAGDILNPQIYPQWLNEAEFFESQGFDVCFAWWDQIFKDNCDIDELEDTSEIRNLTIGEFKTLVDEYNSEGFRKWRESRKFTPTITVSDPDGFKFPELPESNAIISVKSGMGRGKTKEELGLIKLSPNRAFLIGSLNNLLIQTSARGEEIGLKIYHLLNDDARGLVADVNTHIECCIDSMHHLDGYFLGADIYLDEIYATVTHTLNGGTLGENQAKAMAVFEKAVRECSRVIMLDANNSDIITDFISSIDPTKKVVKILDTVKPQSHEFKIVDGYDVEKDKLKKRDRSPIIQFMCDEEVKPFIASDSRELTNTYSQILIDSNKRGFVLNRDTVSNDESLEFLKNPDAFLDKHQPDFYAISPTANQGVSITNGKYFTHKVSIFTGVLGTNQQTQQLMRLRTKLDHFIICPEFSTIRNVPRPSDFSNKSLQEITLDKINLSASLSNSSEDMAQILAKAFSEKAEDKWFKLSMQLGELDNFERDNLRKCLMFALREQGHKVETIQMNTSEEYAQLEKTIKDELRLERATAVHKANPFNSVEEASQEAKKSPKPEIMRRIEKTRLIDRLPGIDQTEIFTPEFIKKILYDDKELIGNLQRYYFLQNFDISKKRSEVNWYYQATNQHFFLGSMAKDSHLKIWALQQLGISNIQDKLLEGEELHKDHELVINLYNTAISSYQIMLALGTKVPRATLLGKERTDLLKSCFKMIGVKLKRVGRKLCSDGIRRNCYTIDMDDYLSPERLGILGAIDKKYQNYLESESVKKVNWKVEPPPPEFEEIAENQEIKVVSIDVARKVTKMTQKEMDEKINDGLAFIREYMGCHTLEGLTAFFDLQGMNEADTKHIKKRVWEQLTTEEKRILKSLSSDNVAA